MIVYFGLGIILLGMCGAIVIPRWQKEKYIHQQWLNANSGRVCCDKAEPISCVGSFCSKCKIHGETHIGDHE